MATYQEIFDLQRDNVILDRIITAVGVAASSISNEVNTTSNYANRILWAKKAFSNPMAEAKKFQMAVLSLNKAATVSQITSAADSAIQTNVDSIVNIFADGS